MIWFLALLAVAQQAAVPPPPSPPPRSAPPGLPPPDPASGPAMARMAALYDEVCLKAFPDDGAVDRLMAAKGATALIPEQVQRTFRSDPGRGWLLQDGERRVQIMLELPPFHACSVRQTLAPGFRLFEYQAITDAFKASRPGFVAVNEEITEIQGLRIRATGQIRTLPDGSDETLLVFDQQVADPARRARGETGVDIRFVHQIIAPGAQSAATAPAVAAPAQAQAPAERVVQINPAPKWIEFSKGDPTTRTLVDETSVSVTDGRLRYVASLLFEPVHASGVRSVFLLSEVDCAARTSRILGSDQLGRANDVRSSQASADAPMQPFTPNSFNEAVAKKYCPA